MDFNPAFSDAYATEPSAESDDFPYLRSIFDELGGHSIEKGLFRVHTPDSSLVWSRKVGEFFTEFAGKIQIFGFDWLGRQYATLNEPDDRVYLFDPSLGEVLPIPSTPRDIFNVELVDYKKETFAPELFQALAHLYAPELDMDKCLGFDKPLLEGGDGELTNYKVADVSAYWEKHQSLFTALEDWVSPEFPKVGA